MLGGIGNPKACCGRVDKGRHLHSFSARDAKVCKQGCLEHWLRELWHDISRDSYRVQADKVYNSQGAGKYLSKYFAKTFSEHKEMWDAGFKRRYSMSRNVPKLERLQLSGTKDKKWGRVERVNYPANELLRRLLNREVEASEVSKREELVKVGDRYLVEVAEAAPAKKLRRLLDANVS